MKILVVDDDRFIRELVVMILESGAHHAVTTAASGAEALALVEGAAEPFDCALLDIQMPGMHGVELCTHLRARADCRRMPILMLTAMTERDFIENAFAAGANDYVTKPFDVTELRARVRMAEELVEARRAEPAGPEAGAELPPIEGVARLTDGASLRNYLSQLSRAGLMGSQVFALRLDGMARLAARATPGEMTYALTEVALAVSEVMAPYGGMFGHMGGGDFICAPVHPTLPDAEEIESAVQAMLDERDAQFDDGAPMDLEVSAGAPVRLGAGSAQAMEQWFERARARAERRAQQKAEAPRMPGIRSVGSWS